MLKVPEFRCRMSILPWAGSWDVLGETVPRVGSCQDIPGLFPSFSWEKCLPCSGGCEEQIFGLVELHISFCLVQVLSLQ